MSSVDNAPLCSVVILGELSVGKSALCRNFFRKALAQQQVRDFTLNNETVDELLDEQSAEPDAKHYTFQMTVSVNGLKNKIRILDVNTEKQFSESSCVDGFSDLQQYLSEGDGYIVAYAVTDKGTFQTARNILRKICEIGSLGNNRRPVILVGNKCDLVRKRQVSNKEGIKLAEKYQAKFIETSATLHQNVDQLFQGIVKQIRLRNLEVESSRKSVPARRISSEIPHGSNAKVQRKKSDSYSMSTKSSSQRDNHTENAKTLCNSQKGKNINTKGGLTSKCLKLFTMNKKKTNCKSCQDFSYL